MSCNGCDEIITVGNSGTDGWTPILALSEVCDDKIVHQVISFTGGTGTRPSYDGNIMTDAWLLANPVYLSTDGYTEDCDEAINLKPTDGTNGTNGTNGATGEQGTDGCNPDITFNITAGSEEIACTVTEGEGSTTCAPIFDINIPDEAFTNDTVIDTITATEAFTTAIDTYIATVLSPTPTFYELLSGDIGTTTGKRVKYTVTTNSGTLTLKTSLGGTPIPSYFEYKIVGNTMYFNFRLILEGATSDPYFGCYLEFLIPNSETANYLASNAISITTENTPVSGVPERVGIITTNATTGEQYLKVGILQQNSNIGGLSFINGEYKIFKGQLTFTID